MYLQNHIQLHIAEMHNKREEETGRSSDMHHLCLDLPPNRSTFVESRRRNRISAAINRWATIQHYDDSNFPSKGLATLSYNSSSPFSLLLPLLLPFATPPPPPRLIRPGCITILKFLKQADFSSTILLSSSPFLSHTYSSSSALSPSPSRQTISLPTYLPRIMNEPAMSAYFHDARV